MISVYQIYFDKKSEQGLDPQFIPFHKEWKDDYFENSVIKKVYEKNKKDATVKSDDYIGITSWKMGNENENKVKLTAQEIIDFIQTDILTGSAKDVYIYSPLQGVVLKDKSFPLHADIVFPQIWDMYWHKTIEVGYANKLLNDSGVLPFDIYDGKWQFCHCNYWIAKKEIFFEYCEKVLLPAYYFFERHDIKAMMPKWYKHRHDGNLYNSCSFTFEGLFGSFLAHNIHTFDYIAKYPYQNKYQFIKVDKYIQQ